MMGILPNIASSLRITIPVAGHFISAYALGVCFGAIMLLMLRKYPMKNSLLLLSHYGNWKWNSCYISKLYSYAISSFYIWASSWSLFWSCLYCCIKIAQEGKESEAVAIMISGMTVANLFGSPSWEHH